MKDLQHTSPKQRTSVTVIATCWDPGAGRIWMDACHYCPRAASDISASMTKGSHFCSNSGMPASSSLSYCIEILPKESKNIWEYACNKNKSPTFFHYFTSHFPTTATAPETAVCERWAVRGVLKRCAGAYLCLWFFWQSLLLLNQYCVLVVS